VNIDVRGMMCHCCEQKVRGILDATEVTLFDPFSSLDLYKQGLVGLLFATTGY